MEQVLSVKMWLYGLVATVINGFASGVVLSIADPEHFNIFSGRRELLTVSLVMGLLGAANFLKQHPLPTWDGEERRNRPPDA